MLHLNTNDAQFEALHETINAAREGSKTVKVDRAALVALLHDHGRLVGVLNDNGIKWDAAALGSPFSFQR